MRRILALGLLLALTSLEATANPLVNPPGNVVTRVESTSRLWTLSSRIQMRRARGPIVDRYSFYSPTQPAMTDAPAIGFPEHTFVHPMVVESSSSIAYPDMAFLRVLQRDPYLGERTIVPDLKPIRDVLVTNASTLTHAGEHAVGTIELRVPELAQRIIDFESDLRVRTWETDIDEFAADAIDWPVDGYPAELQRYLGEEMFVDPEAQEMHEIVGHCLGENPGETNRPYALAKRLAACVMTALTVTETEYEWRLETEGGGQCIRAHFTVDSSGRWTLTDFQQGVETPTRVLMTRERERRIGEGPVVTGSVETARRGIGTGHDAAALMVALFRRAGLPARLVVGLDTERQRQYSPSNALVLRTWCEFALYDEDRGVVEWVPVDVARQLETSSRVPPLDRVWPYFGRHEGLDTTIPLSFHFVLPDTESPLIRPGLWGYRGKLAMPPMTTDIEFEAHTPSKRGDDPPDPYAP